MLSCPVANVYLFWVLDESTQHCYANCIANLATLGDTLNEYHLLVQAILLFNRVGWFSAAQLSKAANCTIYRARKACRGMLDANIIVRQRNQYAFTATVTLAGEYRRMHRKAGYHVYHPENSQ